MILEIERGVSKENLDRLPLFFSGSVICGFGRGSKQLGIPTANLPVEEVEETLKDIPVGVYYGWANVKGLNDEKVYPMAMSIGWNPFYKNTKKTIEIHLIQKFDFDFYGSELRAIGLGFIRPMCDFKSLEELVKAINDDIEYAKTSLEKPQSQEFINHPFFSNDSNKNTNYNK